MSKVFKKNISIISHGFYILTPFFIAVYNQEQLICTKQEALGLKSSVYGQEWF